MQTMASQMTNDVNEMRLLMRQTVENVKKDAIHEAETRSKNYDNFLAKKNEEYKVALEEASYQFQKEARTVARSVATRIANTTANYRLSLYGNFEMSMKADMEGALMKQGEEAKKIAARAIADLKLNRTLHDTIDTLQEQARPLLIKNKRALIQFKNDVEIM